MYVLLTLGLATACGAPSENGVSPAQRKSAASADHPRTVEGKSKISTHATASTRGTAQITAKPRATESSPATPAKASVAAAASGVERAPQGRPPWLSPNLIQHKKIAKDSRSEMRIDGNYSGILILHLTDEQTEKSCIETLHAKLKPLLDELGEITSGAETDLEFKGSDALYEVSCMCGKDKDGVLSGLISYSTKN